MIRSKTLAERPGAEGDEQERSPSAGDAEETSPDIVNEDAMECKISSNSYKLEFVEGGQSIFYKKRSLPKARVDYPIVTRKLSENFQRWLETWVMENVSRDQKSTCDQWLAGNSDGLRQCVTIKQPVRENFKSYTKYLVEWPTPTAISSSDNAQV